MTKLLRYLFPFNNNPTSTPYLVLLGAFLVCVVLPLVAVGVVIVMVVL